MTDILAAPPASSKKARTRPAGTATAFPGTKWETASPESVRVNSDGLNNAMDHLAAICGEDGNTQAMVIRHGRVIWQGNNTGSMHNVFSCTKSFLSITAGVMADDGRISLDTKLSDILPVLKENYPDVTLGHCLSLTDGYRADGDAYPFTPAAPLFKPGTRFYYGIAGPALASRALATRNNGPLDDLFMERIGTPIGIAAPVFSWGDYGFVDGIRVNGGSGANFRSVRTNARAMARFGLLLLNNGSWNGTHLVSPEWIKTVTSQQAPADLPAYEKADHQESLRGGYGYGFWVNDIRADGKRLWPDAPEYAYALQGARNNLCAVFPEWDMVFVRLGTDRIIPTEQYTEVFAMIKAAME